MEKKQYESPEIQICMLDGADIITSSGDNSGIDSGSGNGDY